MQRKKDFILSLLVILALIFSGCHFKGTNSPKNHALNMPETQEPPTLDSAKSTDAVSNKVLNNIMEGLFRNGPNGNLEFGMAKTEPKVSKGGKSYTFTLREAFWSDGQPVTAKDFEYAWKRALNKKTASEYAFILYPIKNAEAFHKGKLKEDAVGVKAVNDKTLQVELEKPLSYFKYLLTLTTYFPQRKDIVEKFGDMYAIEISNLVYNGPFVLSLWKHHECFQYKKNGYYWDKDAVRLTEINTIITKDTQTSLNLYKTGKLDYTLLDADFREVYKNSPEKISLDEAVTCFFEVNQKNYLLKNRKIRNALYLAINKQELVERVMKNGGVPAGRLVPPILKEGLYQEKDKPLEFHPLKAKQLWNEALKETGQKRPEKLELIGDNHTSVKRLLEYVQEQLRNNLGIEVQIVTIPYKQRLQRVEKGQFDIALSVWKADFKDPVNFLNLLVSGSSFNHGGYSNKAYDKLILKADSRVSNNKRLQDLREAEDILLRDRGVIPLYHRGRVGLKKPYVKGIAWHSVGPEYDLKWAYMDHSKE